MASEPNQRQRNILRRLPHSLSIDSAQTPINRPLTAPERENLATLNKLKEFLATAPARWSPPDAPGSIPFPNPSPRPALNRFSLPSNEYVTCVLWQGQYYISGTDIVRSLVFRFEAFGRPVRNMKKFEEGVFSDLRNLKPGSDATLEEPKSSFLDLLYKYQCIRTQKKQKVFFWFSVPHDRLFFDALERDVKRENMGSESATVATNEPALSFQPNLNSGKTLWEEWIAKVKKSQESGELVDEPEGSGMGLAPSDQDSQAWAGGLELFEGSPAYKQRRKRRSPVATRGTDNSRLAQDTEYRRQGGLVRSNSLGTPRASQQTLGASRRDYVQHQSQNFYPSALPNHSTPNIHIPLLGGQPGPYSASASYPPSLPLGRSSESLHLDQASHVVRSHSSAASQRPFSHAPEPSTTFTRPTYNPYPRPQPRMTQNRNSTDLSTTNVAQQLTPHDYAMNAPYVASQAHSQFSTLPFNLQPTYSSNNPHQAAEGPSSGDNISSVRAFVCPTCGKTFHRLESWRNHVNEHSLMNGSTSTQDIVECHPDQHDQQYEDGSAWAAPQYERQAPPPSNNVGSSDGNTAHYAEGLATMPITSANSAWVSSPFSSSGSTRSNHPPSPSSSPSASSYAPPQHGQAVTLPPTPYVPASEFPRVQVRSAPGFEGGLGAGIGFFPGLHRSETPGMESRPQTASSYDSAANLAIHGRSDGPIDATAQYGRHSSAPVSMSSGRQTNSNVYGAVPHVPSTLYYNTGGVAYSAPVTASGGYHHGSPSMEDYQAATHASGSGYAVSTAASDSGFVSTSSAFADTSASAAATRVGQWGTDYHSTPSPPDSMAVDASQQEASHQQPVSGVTMYPANQSDGAMRYFQASGTP